MNNLPHSKTQNDYKGGQLVNINSVVRKSSGYLESPSILMMFSSNGKSHR